MRRRLTIGERALDAALRGGLSVLELVQRVKRRTFGTSWRCSWCGVYVEGKVLPDGWRDLDGTHFVHVRCPERCPTCGLSLDLEMDWEHATCPACERVAAA